MLDTKWIDQSDVMGPFDGVLMVLGFGRDDAGRLVCFTSERVPSSYVDKVAEAINNAHAKGMLVAYLFADSMQVSPPPFEFDFIESMDIVRPVAMYGRGDLNFSLLPTKRTQEIVDIAKEMGNDKRLKFSGGRVEIVGACKIDGEDVLLPFTAI
jgi:hypothetical protein